MTGAAGSASVERSLEIRLLGPLRVSVDGRPVDLPGERLPAMIAVLAMSAGEVVSVNRLATAVWGESIAVDAKANVHSNVKRLRRLLGDDLVITRGAGYALKVDPDRVDALRFVHLLDRAAADRTNERSRLVEALALWRGSPFDGVRSEWLEQTQVPRLEERYLAGLERRIDLELSDGTDLTATLGELRELTGRHPLRESLWMRLLLVLDRLGRPAEALERYEALRVRLAEELGTDPGSDLQRIYTDLLSGIRAAEPPATGGVQAPADAPRRVPPRQLPADIEALTGRAAPLATLDELLSGDGETVVISAIAGTAGVGKTSLAIHWAHRVADRFPDGQLYVNLRGFDPSGSPLAPTEAVRGFLEALQVPSHRIPATPDAQTGLYRSLLAGTRTLVLLDNARDAGQVAPLLPGAPGCLVLVTSRNQLPGLVASTGAHTLTLDRLGNDEAEQLLVRRLSSDRVSADPDATRELITRCAGLPLALAIVAARAVLHPELPLAALAAQLRDGDESLDGFDAGDYTSSARVVFSWSYHSLTPPAAHLFRLFGLHPGPDITPAAAASLAGIPIADVRRQLAVLARSHLVTEHLPGRYVCHDLLRAYTRELVDAEATSAERQAATHRLLDHYLHTAHEADLLLFRHGETTSLPMPQPGVSIERLADQSEAMSWFRAEHQVLLKAIRYAASNGLHRHACQLAWTLFVYLHRQGHWHDRVATQHAALEAARQLDDPAMHARAHRHLGFAYADLGRHDDADIHLRRALDLAEAAGDIVGQAWTQSYRDLVYGQLGRDADALDAAQRALDLFEAAGHQAGRAIALSDVGWYHGRLGNHEQALRFATQALALHQQLDNRPYQAHTWACLGDTHRRRGDHSNAVECYHHARQLFEELGDRYGEASTLAHLGELHHDAGDPESARDAWRQARALLSELDPAAAEQVRAMLTF